MKAIIKNIFISFFFGLAFLFFNNLEVCAKTVSNGIFEVTVGEQDTLPLYYTLEESDNDVKERVQFNVTLKGISEVSNSYRWEHIFCYKIKGEENEVCEVDLTGIDNEDNPQEILSNKSYSFTFYDEDMPYYSESLEFEYITFKNNFVCLDCDNNDSISLENIEFSSNYIQYKYSYDLNVNYVENNGKKYVKNYSSSLNNLVFVAATFANNSASSLVIDGSPTYKLVNEICVGDSLCVSEEISEVYSSSDTNNENPLSITPYLGNLTFYYSGNNLVYDDGGNISYEFARYKTTLVCLTNCDSKRVVSSIELIDETYYFDYTKPEVDKENTVINSFGEEIEYVKNSEVKITIKDSQSGIDDSRLKYYIVTPFANSCAWGSSKSYSFTNGESFTIGEGLNGGYCMYYVAYDKNGNYYQSEYYVFYFDNNGPVMNFTNDYDSNKYYNEIVINPTFVDNYSGMKNVYYLWSKESIDENNYLFIKEKGVLYDGSVSSTTDIKEDGTYYLYFLAFDNLDNYKLYDLGVFNVDTIGLGNEDVIVDKYNLGDSYSNTGKIKIAISELEDNIEIKCGLSKTDNVSVSDLSLICLNNKEISIPNGIEGEYSFWIYVNDRASNYSLLKIVDNLKVDTKGPSIEYEILYEDDSYRMVNDISIDVNDLVGVKLDSLKYGWFKKDKTNVISSDLSSSFVSGGKISYPLKHYGEYKLYVRAIDNLGNETFKEISHIFKIDTDVIRISLIGEDSISILKGEKYEDSGAKAYKGEVSSGGRISEIKVEGEVNTSKAGTYYITYSSGEGDLLVSVTRKVVVKNDLGYVLGSFSLFVLGALIISLRLFISKKE